MIQAIVGMWRKVGIEADIEVYEIAKHYELRAADKLAPAAFYNWGNAIGDPTTSTGFAMFGPSPHSVWDAQDLIDADRSAVGREGRGEAHRRLEGRRQARSPSKAYVIPLLQYVQPIVHSKDRQGGAARLRRAAAGIDDPGVSLGTKASAPARQLGLALGSDSVGTSAVRRLHRACVLRGSPSGLGGASRQPVRARTQDEDGGRFAA